VKAGRGIVPTARAEALAVRARVLLEDLRGFATPEGFDPQTLQTTFTIAANDLQCDLLLPAAAAPAARAGAWRGPARGPVRRAAAPRCCAATPASW
jgi:DNA-binding transcriptional LysR family regulator